MHDGYTKAYFAKIGKASHSSAAVVAPLVMNLLQPASVVDVGCGVGAWAAAFKQLGVADVIGIDGPYVSLQDLVIEAKVFVSFDLTQPLELGRQFDLAVSLEVAEHLPESAANQLVATLTQHAPAVLFSAAIPHQGGEDHINEQWPTYWAGRFAEHGFMAVDALRSQVWNEPNVEWWYAQNMLIFATGAPLQQLLANGYSACKPTEVLPLVHPGNYSRQAWHNRVLHTCIDLATVVPEDARLIFVDDNLCGAIDLRKRHVLPFTEKDGAYGGPPEDEAAALSELKRQIASGARYIAFAWPSFWHLEHYPRLERFLRSEHLAVYENDRVVVFELQV